jgi:hypothetical protein
MAVAEYGVSEKSLAVIHLLDFLVNSPLAS